MMNPLYIFKTGSTYPDIAQVNGDFEAMIAAPLIPCPLPLRTINIPAGEPLPAPEACAGVIIPMLRERLGADPAIGGSVMITALTDSGGFFIFLGLATLFLL